VDGVSTLTIKGGAWFKKTVVSRSIARLRGMRTDSPKQRMMNFGESPSSGELVSPSHYSWLQSRFYLMLWANKSPVSRKSATRGFFSFPLFFYNLVTHILVRHFCGFFFFRFFGHSHLRGEKHSRGGRRVLQSGPGNLYRVNDSFFY